jgi:serine protease Do
MNPQPVTNSNPNNRKFRFPQFILAGSILAAVSVFAVNHEELGVPKKPAIVLDAKPLSRDAKLSTSFAPVIKRVSPSVVKVVVSGKAQNVGLPDGFDDNPWLRKFFGQQGRRGQLPQMPKQQGLGSGVIVTQDGYVLTNNHVVDHASDVRVSLQDGTEYTAKVVGTDPKTDLAVIKVNATGLPAIQMTDSEGVEVGDTVLAIGNPFGIGQTVTSGIVSATGRSAIGLDYEDFIQTDAAINPGNSGGALVDAEGRLIGINTAILSRSGGNQGIGFAIPSNLARDVMESLISDGKVVRGYLGVMVQDLSPAIAKKFNTDAKTGALVGDVSPKSPAAEAGLESGDVITEFAGRPVRSSHTLRLQVARTKPGEKIDLKVMRNGAEKAVTVKVGELPHTDKLAKAGSDSTAHDNGTLNGVAVADLDSQARREYRIPGTVQGALITDVDESSVAAEAGLSAGDVILEINREKVTSAQEAVRLTEHPADKTTLVKVWSKGATRFVVVDESHVG